MDLPTPVLVAGTGHPELAAAVAAHMGLRPARCAIERFPDGETSVRLEEPVRRREVVIVQPTAPPVNDSLMELLCLVDACRRSGAARITAVMPYFGYARADRRHGHGEPITASLVASLLQTAGVDHVVTVDLHTPQVEGFFRIPVDELSAVPLLCSKLEPSLPQDAVIVAPDAGRVKLASVYAERIGRPLVLLHKLRLSSRETRTAHLIGDVEGRACLLVDDMISTGGTLAESARALRAAGAARITAAATHALPLAGTAERLRAAGIDQVVVTNTVPGAGGAGQVASVAPLLAEVLARAGAPDAR